MSLLARLIPNIFRNVLPAPSGAAGGLFDVTIRSIMRNNFPRPSERRRLVRHSWKTRMSTRAGRRILMNRILKGNYVYSH